METKRILVFGTSGAGKTNMLNELTGIPFDDGHSEEGSVFKIRQYPPVNRNNVVYEFFDIDGISKTHRDKLTFAEIQENINNLLQCFKGGFNLLIFVTKSGTIHESAKDEYIMFADRITKQKVPVLGVVTNCENIEPMSRWVVDNENAFLTNGMKFSGMVATCFLKGGRLEEAARPLREESVKTVWDAILATSTEQSIDLITLFESSSAFAINVWKNVCERMGNEMWTEPIPGTMRLLRSKKK